LQLEDRDRKRPTRGRLTEGNDIECEVFIPRDRQHLAGITFGGSFPTHCLTTSDDGPGHVLRPGTKGTGKRRVVEGRTVLRPFQNTDDVATPAFGEVTLSRQRPSPFFLANTPSTQRFSSVPGG